MPHLKQGTNRLDIVSDKLRRPAFGARPNGTFFYDVLSGPILFDDFLGDVLSDPWGEQHGNDGSVVAPAINAQSSGVVRMVTGAGAGDTFAANGVHLHSALQWKLNSGNTIFEARVKSDAVTNYMLYVGFTDQIASLEAPMTLSGTTFTTNATDAVGFLFDTAATTDTIRLCGVASDVDATHVDSSVVPVLAVYNKYRLEIDSTGLALFYIDDILYGSLPVAATITVAMTPVIAAMSHTTTVRNVDIDYVYVSQDRV